MQWFGIILQLLIPVGIVIYTINFGRWMAGRQIKSGAYAAYAIATIAFGLTVWVVLRNNL
ncbi:hypothetical protein [Effusibacillus lacus]|uniref:Uncharacterized protein n=1 Tax=Effusibacillus lacus TaxID=1348429 RepID=A0A292YES5_9BACL|nr:hypothetical protein [Effusibacillus lacus]TCS73564.1 hypothetical protein EDD64_11871 [Effusibacillus lacus]GAX91942.1 hypothetical protein EFBL_3633 [Effusibacillus lacus]